MLSPQAHGEIGLPPQQLKSDFSRFIRALLVSHIAMRVSVLTIDTFCGGLSPGAMPRKLRLEVAGAIYHVVNRADAA